MAVSEGGCVKEQTIRGLLAECRKGQSTIRELLDSNFNRELQENVMCESKCEGAPFRPNVLDEIMDSLKDLDDAQRGTIEFIKTHINPKL